MAIRVGTSGWAYAAWKPGFYPPKLPSKDFLKFYATQLNAVEVNYTFRRFLTEKVIAGWIEQTPATFHFIVKAHQVLGIFCGHAHVTYEKYISGIPVFGLRSTAPQLVVVQEEPLICIQPPHYRLVTLADGILATRIFEVPLS